MGAVPFVYMEASRAITGVVTVAVIVSAGIVSAGIVIVAVTGAPPISIIGAVSMPVVIVAPIALIAIIVASNLLRPSPVASIVGKRALSADEKEHKCKQNPFHIVSPMLRPEDLRSPFDLPMLCGVGRSVG